MVQGPDVLVRLHFVGSFLSILNIEYDVFQKGPTSRVRQEILYSSDGIGFEGEFHVEESVEIGFTTLLSPFDVKDISDPKH